MTKPARKAVAVPPHLPGDPPTPEQERASSEATAEVVRRELADQLSAEEASLRRVAAEMAAAGVQVVIPKDITAEQRAKSHEESVEFILAEMREQDALNPPRAPLHLGMDDASFEMIKAEVARTKKRIVLPSG